MAQRYPNPRRVKIHYNYTVEETARLCSRTPNTVLRWVKEGLPVCEGTRPWLIRGRDLADFLGRKRAASKCPCKPDELFCVACRRPTRPFGGTAEYRPSTAKWGTLIGTCPTCERRIYRKISPTQVAALVSGTDLVITTPADQISVVPEKVVTSKTRFIPNGVPNGSANSNRPKQEEMLLSFREHFDSRGDDYA